MKIKAANILAGIAALCLVGCDKPQNLATIPDYVPRTLYSLPDYDRLIDSESVTRSFGANSITTLVFYSTGVETSVLNVASVILPTKDGYPIHLIREPGRYTEIDWDEKTGLFKTYDVFVREDRNGHTVHESFFSRYYSRFPQTRTNNEVATPP
jgi:hypothetical protein